MNALNYTLDLLRTSSATPEERNLLKALVRTLDSGQLARLESFLHLYVRAGNRTAKDLLREMATLAHAPAQAPANEPVTSLLNLFANKKSRKVADARKKLKLRYEYQSFAVQRRILKAFLNSGNQADRGWAYRQLLKRWDEHFGSSIRLLWETHREEGCARVVINSLPEPYVWEHRAALGAGSNYIPLCIRLAKHPGFEIDRSRINDGPSGCDYLYIMARAGRKIKGEEALEPLFRFIAGEISGSRYSMARSRVMECNRDTGSFLYLSTMLIPGVERVIWCMGRLGLAEELIFYSEWDNGLREEFAEIWEEYAGSYENKQQALDQAWALFCDIARSRFPSPYAAFLQESPEEDDLLPPWEENF